MQNNRQILVWVARSFGLYLAVLVLGMGWSFAVSYWSWAEQAALRLQKPIVAIGTSFSPTVVSTTMSANGVDLPIDPRVRDVDSLSLADVDRFLFLIGDFKDQNAFQVARNVGFNIHGPRDGAQINVQSVSMDLRMHVLPLQLKVRRATYINLEHFVSSYDFECLPRMFMDRALGQVDQAKDAACKLL